MKIPGNMWVEAWETARVTPARRQRRLFDDTKEAEKVIVLLTWDLKHLQLTSKVTGLTKFIVCCLAHMDLSVIPTIKPKKESIKYLAEINVSLYRHNRCNWERAATTKQKADEWRELNLSFHLSGSALFGSAETCRLDPPSPALHTPCSYSEVKGGR